jgi:phosphate transport system permease protein
MALANPEQSSPKLSLVVPPRPEGEPAPLREGPSARALLEQSSTGNLADRVFRLVVLGCALSVPFIVALILSEMLKQSRLSMREFGWKFCSGHDWDPVSGVFGAAPFIYGALVSSAIALVIAVLLSVGVALFMLADVMKKSPQLSAQALPASWG